MYSKFFNATCKANGVGDGTVGALVSWLEQFINVLFPENGIEYWSDDRYGKGRYLKRDLAVPAEGLTDDSAHHTACYVREGSNEGRIIEVALYLRGDELKSLAWIKTFGNSDECWSIARAINDALNAIIFWNAVPEMVAMSAKVPRQHSWYRRTSLEEEVTVLSTADTVQVTTASGLVLDNRSWVGQTRYAGSNPKVVTQDWITVLTNTKCFFKVIEETADRLVVPDLPGFVISKRGIEVEGFYVLPPGGNELDDRTYLGYFPDEQSAIKACRDYLGQHQLPLAA